MSASFRQKASLVLFAIALFCLLLAPTLSFIAGCAGDAKSGTVGDIGLALHYGDLAMLALFAGMSLGAVGFIVRPAPAISQRAAYAIAWFVIGAVLFWAAAFQTEIWGIQSCFGSQ
jgi:hypothetical protein